MFTGIIETVGTVKSIRHGTKSAVLVIEAPEIMDDVKTGDSIAVNGVCLTARELHAGGFTADVMAETLKRSSLGELQAGSHVNLERAMPSGGRFGGHIVSGHIDGTGIIKEFRREDVAVWVTVQADGKLMRYIIEKGSVALDGVSLTVAEVLSDSFRVSLIPHTAKETILLDKKVGSRINIENDVIGKYVERLMTHEPEKKQNGTGTDPSGGLSMEFLAENGFL